VEEIWFIDFGILKAATYERTKPGVVLSGRGWHPEKSMSYFSNGWSYIDDIWQPDAK